MATFTQITSFLLLLCLVHFSCANQKVLPPNPKIDFDMNTIDKAGLIGPPNGKVALSYEFCIPAEDKYVQEVQQIDPSLRINKIAKGRVGCSKVEWLCIGNTHQEAAKKKIQQLAELSYVKRIQRAYFE